MGFQPQTFAWFENKSGSRYYFVHVYTRVGVMNNKVKAGKVCLVSNVAYRVYEYLWKFKYLFKRNIMSGRSLMWMINAVGPVLLPWWTPALTRASCKNSLWNLVSCDLTLRYDFSQEIRAGLTPAIFSQFSNSLLWSTKS
jgi:hypothetical protein